MSIMRRYLDIITEAAGTSKNVTPPETVIHLYKNGSIAYDDAVTMFKEKYPEKLGQLEAVRRPSDAIKSAPGTQRVYRGAMSGELDKGLTSGTWVTPNYSIASQYASEHSGAVHAYDLPEKLNLLDTNSQEGKKIARKLRTDPDLLWYNPGKAVVKELRARGYDGFINNTDMESDSWFIANPKLLKIIAADSSRRR